MCGTLLHPVVLILLNSPGLGTGRVRSPALGLYKEQHLFFYRSHPEMDNFHNTNQHRATTAATVAVVAAVAAQIIVSCLNTRRARGAAWEPPDLRIDPQFSVLIDCWASPASSVFHVL